MNPVDDIFIHGLRNGFGWIGKYHILLDWTKVCIAVTNDETEEIYNSVNINAKVEVRQ